MQLIIVFIQEKKSGDCSSPVLAFLETIVPYEAFLPLAQIGVKTARECQTPFFVELLHLFFEKRGNSLSVVVGIMDNRFISAANVISQLFDCIFNWFKHFCEDV